MAGGGGAVRGASGCGKDTDLNTLGGEGVGMDLFVDRGDDVDQCVGTYNWNETPKRMSKYDGSKKIEEDRRISKDIDG